MDENKARQDKILSRVESSTSTKRTRLALLLIALAIIILSISCLALFWNITSLTLSYPNAGLGSFDWKIELPVCGDHGRALIWASSVKFISTDEVAQVESWYQEQGWNEYVTKIYKGVKGGALGFEQDWLMLHIFGVRSVLIDRTENSSQIELRTVMSFCLFGN